jgi:hypothetical protein
MTRHLLATPTPLHPIFSRIPSRRSLERDAQAMLVEEIRDLLEDRASLGPGRSMTVADLIKLLDSASPDVSRPSGGEGKSIEGIARIELSPFASCCL